MKSKLIKMVSPNTNDVYGEEEYIEPEENEELECDR